MRKTQKDSTAIGALLVHEPKNPLPQQKRLTIPVPEACRLSGLGATTIWQFIRDGRLEIVRIAGIKRTLIICDSLERLLAPACSSGPALCKRSRPRKISDAMTQKSHDTDEGSRR
jgi:hypothetical protein